MRSAGVCFLVVVMVCIGIVGADSAKEILDGAGVKGGVIVHLGCGDGRFTVALHVNDGCLVHGLDADSTNVEKARAQIRSRGLYGPVSAMKLVGTKLPYAENLVNLIVTEDPGAISMDEVIRVLVPNGVALIKKGQRWQKTVKPRPEDIDEWSHFLHDASNNAVARDRRVGPPRRLQWTAGPAWCRSHEFISSFCAMVSAQGRVFYVLDEGQPGVTDARLPERWMLIARDAFNGVLLWKRPLPDWRADEWKGASMRGRPPSVPRRIVADAERLYATLSHEGALSVIDAATGKTLRTIEGTEGTQEIILTGRTLVLRLAPLQQAGGRTSGSIVAVDADSAEVQWHHPAARFESQSLAADSSRVIYSNQAETVCLKLADGEELWRTSNIRQVQQPTKKQGQKAKAKKPRPRDRTFIIYGDSVFETDGSRIVARDAGTGKPRWTIRTGGGSMRAHDLYVARNTLWHAEGGGIAGYDLATGERTTMIDPSDVQSRGHHLRCYRGKATERFFITQFRGAEFISLTGGEHTQNDWVRGPCRYGVMPCNGMLYTPPHQCFCFSGAMLSGLNAFTTAPDDQLHAIGPAAGADSIQRGPAWGKIDASKAKAGGDGWPMYRHDARRTGASDCEVGAKLEKIWDVELRGPLTPPVAVAGRVYLAAKDRHTVYALSADDGGQLWQFTADGRIDSAPTIHQGRVMFGCADGWVYCLRASDGQLAWRSRVAPVERLIVAHGQLESTWRVHGSVLVQNDMVYCTAGRSSFLDGGIYFYALNPRTGKVIHTGRLDTLWGRRTDAVGEPFLPAFHIQGTRSDLLVAEGGFVYLNQMKFAPDLKQQRTRYIPREDDRTTGLDIAGKPYVAENPYLAKGFDKAAALGVRRGHMGDQDVGLHLFSTGGFLEDSWFNRTFWMYAETWPGFQMGHIAPKAGHLLVIGEDTTYAVHAYPARNIHSPMFTPATRGYLLIADDNDNEPMLDYRSWARDKGMGFTRKNPPRWHKWIPIRMRSMALAGANLFVAGAPDVLDPADPMAAFEGRKGGLLWALSAANGDKLAQYKLADEPVFDGMIAAGKRLYLSTVNGRVVCMGKNN